MIYNVAKVLVHYMSSVNISYYSMSGILAMASHMTASYSMSTYVKGKKIIVIRIHRGHVFC